MEFQNSFRRQKLAYLTALTLLFSYAEMILPRFIPFFRLGLANVVILLCLEIDLSSFILLTLLKAFAASLMGGTLFSPFFIISLLQSLASSLVMRLLFKLLRKALNKKLLSLCGISVLGSAVSAFVQLALASIYLGQETMALLGPMLLFNTASGFLTAVFALLLIEEGLQKKLELGNQLKIQEDDEENSFQNNKFFLNQPLQIFFALFILLASASLFFIKNLYLLTVFFIISLVLQALSKRKIFWLSYLSLWLFIFLTAFFSPNGKVIFKLGSLSLTQGSLLLSLQKALVLSSVSALSQTAAHFHPSKESLLGMSLEYYRRMNKKFREEKGSLLKRLLSSLV